MLLETLYQFSLIIDLNGLISFYTKSWFSKFKVKQFQNEQSYENLIVND